MEIKHFIDELEEKKRILFWLIEGQGQLGLPISSLKWLTKEIVCRLYNIEPKYFEK